MKPINWDNKVKSIYLKYQRPSSSRNIPQKVWTKLWSIPTIPKVRNFIWRIVRHWMASKENLYRKKCAQSPLCPICEKETESIEHILFRCPWTETVWFGCGLTYWINEQSTVTVDKWVEDILGGSMAKEAGPEVVILCFKFAGPYGRRVMIVFSMVSYESPTTEGTTGCSALGQCGSPNSLF